MKACPKCKSRATKIFHLNSGKLECQICGHLYDPEDKKREGEAK